MQRAHTGVLLAVLSACTGTTADDLAVSSTTQEAKVTRLDATEVSYSPATGGQTTVADALDSLAARTPGPTSLDGLRGLPCGGTFNGVPGVTLIDYALPLHGDVVFGTPYSVTFLCAYPGGAAIPDPTFIDFGDITSTLNGSPAFRQIVIRNMGAAPVTLSNFTITQPDLDGPVTVYAIVSNTCEATLPSLATCMITVSAIAPFRCCGANLFGQLNWSTTGAGYSSVGLAAFYFIIG